MIKPFEPEEMQFRVTSCLEKGDMQRKIKVYEKILSVCSVCRKIRDDSGKEPGTGPWMPMERFMEDKAGVTVSHGYCPECFEKVREEYRETERRR